MFRHKWIFCFLLWLAPLIVWAGSTSAVLGSFATVQPVLRLSVLSQVATIKISADDIARGYVDIEGATVLKVQTNSRDGYLLSFFNSDPLVTGISIRDGERTTSLSSDGGIMYYANTGINGHTSVLSYRLFFSDQVAAGDYPWPLQLDAMLD